MNCHKVPRKDEQNPNNKKTLGGGEGLCKSRETGVEQSELAQARSRN